MNVIVKRFLTSVIILFFIGYTAVWFVDSYNIEKGQKYINLRQNIIIDTIYVIDEVDEWVLVKHYNDTLVMGKEQIIINYKLVK